MAGLDSPMSGVQEDYPLGEELDFASSGRKSSHSPTPNIFSAIPPYRDTGTLVRVVQVPLQVRPPVHKARRRMSEVST